MIIIQSDENIPVSICNGLRSRGVEIYTMEDENLKGVSDKELFDFCNKRKRVILSNDNDFLEISKHNNHSGIIYMKSQYSSIGSVIQAILRLVDSLPEEEFQNAIFYVP